MVAGVSVDGGDSSQMSMEMSQIQQAALQASAGLAALAGLSIPNTLMKAGWLGQAARGW